MIVDLVGCARCHGDGHEGLEFAELRYPVEHEGQIIATHFALCPVTAEPILMRITPTPATEPDS